MKLLTVSEIQTREREDGIDSDISPVQVSTSVGDRTGRPVVAQANQKSKTKQKRRPRSRTGRPVVGDSDIPVWLQEFRENLVDDEVPENGLSRQFFS